MFLGILKAPGVFDRRAKLKTWLYSPPGVFNFFWVLKLETCSWGGGFGYAFGRIHMFGFYRHRATWYISPFTSGPPSLRYLSVMAGNFGGNSGWLAGWLVEYLLVDSPGFIYHDIVCVEGEGGKENTALWVKLGGLLVPPNCAAKQLGTIHTSNTKQVLIL